MCANKPARKSDLLLHMDSGHWQVTPQSLEIEAHPTQSRRTCSLRQVPHTVLPTHNRLAAKLGGQHRHHATLVGRQVVVAQAAGCAWRRGSSCCGRRICWTRGHESHVGLGNCSALLAIEHMLIRTHDGGITPGLQSDPVLQPQPPCHPPRASTPMDLLPGMRWTNCSTYGGRTSRSPRGLIIARWPPRLYRKKNLPARVTVSCRGGLGAGA